MPRLRQPPSFADRVPAGKPITGDLLSAASGEPLELAERCVSLWFEAVSSATLGGDVLVFDEFVIGRPCPVLLEAAYHLRLIRSAEFRGLFRDEEEQFYLDHEDDDDAYWEPPSIADRVFAAMQHGPERERVAPGSIVGGRVWRAFGQDRERWLSLMILGSTIERLVLELASAIRIGDAAVVDARLSGEREEGLRWGWAA